jgi:hypothetical protein
VARYRKVDPRIWDDEKFLSLSDDGKLLFLFLLTHPHMTSLGAMRATLSGLAEERRWTKQRLSKAFQEALELGMVEHDDRACYVGLPNFLKYNGPESPNVVKSWVQSLDFIPDCSLKCVLVQRVKAFVKALPEKWQRLPEDFGKAFESLSKGSAPARAHACTGARALEQEPEQEQEHEQESSSNEELYAAGQHGSQGVNPDADIRAVFDHYRKYHRRAHPTPHSGQKEWKLIRARFKEGYTTSDLCHAIDGCHVSEWHSGKNDQHKTYQKLELIVRDSDHVVQFIEHYEKHHRRQAVHGKQSDPGLQAELERAKRIRDERMRQRQLATVQSETREVISQ